MIGYRDGMDVTIVRGSQAFDRTRLRPGFAVVLTWPDIKNAEYEVVQRLRQAADNVGVDFTVIDNEGFTLWSSLAGKTTARKRLAAGDVDFVVSLHFESPKLYDVYSYTALWNPPEFYAAAGYQRVVSLLASHDAVLSCQSDLADLHARNIFAGFNRPLHPLLPLMFHSVPEPHYEPSVNAASRLFYVGINWERVTGERGRHHDLLETLDAHDLIDIYGPELFLGRQPWAGFDCYRGEIPFDGESVVKRIHDAGICLALSSEAHQRSGIMSNRLFEGLAAGAVIIANPHPFIDRYFADCVHVVDDKKDPRALAADVRDLVTAIRRDPVAARAWALQAQQRFKEMFTLEQCLRGLFTHHAGLDDRRRREHTVVTPEVTVVLDYSGLDVSAMFATMAMINDQRRCHVDVMLVCDQSVRTRLVSDVLDTHLSSVRSVEIFSGSLSAITGDIATGSHRTGGNGALIGSALGAIKTEFFCIVQVDDLWFSDHLASLAKLLMREPGSAAACSGKIVEDKSDDGVTRRHFEELRFDRFADLLHCALPRESGRFVFHRDLLSESKSLIQLLDGFHARHLCIEALLRGGLAQSGKATYVHQRWKMDDLQPFYSEVLQSSFVLDSYRGDRRWLIRAAEIPLSSNGSSPLAAAQRPHAVAEVGILYDVMLDGDGLAFLRSGFSVPEKHFVWIDGRHARCELSVGDMLPDHDVILRIAGRTASGGAQQVLTVDLNGYRALSREVSEDAEDIRLAIPVAVAEATRRISVVLTLQHAEEVRDAGGAILDPRRLGLRVFAIGIYGRPVTPEKAVLPEAPPGLSIPDTKSSIRASIARVPGARQAKRVVDRLLARP